jgi:hypothetical protein
MFTSVMTAAKRPVLHFSIASSPFSALSAA